VGPEKKEGSLHSLKERRKKEGGMTSSIAAETTSDLPCKKKRRKGFFFGEGKRGTDKVGSLRCEGKKAVSVAEEKKEKGREHFLYEKGGRSQMSPGAQRHKPGKESEEKRVKVQSSFREGKKKRGGDLPAPQGENRSGIRRGGGERGERFSRMNKKKKKKRRHPSLLNREKASKKRPRAR